MPKSSASLLSLRLVALVSLATLAACSDNSYGLPKVFGIEVPKETLDSPQPVPHPDQQALDQEDYPLLGNVPSKPTNFTPQATLDAAKSEMLKDRGQAKTLEQNYQSVMPAAK